MLKVLDMANPNDCGMETCGVLLLDGFKQYAGVSDDSRDALMGGLLKTAIRRVQEYADRAVVETRLQLDTEVGDDHLVRLYMGGGTIASVKDAEGSAVSYVKLDSDLLKIAYRGAVRIVYTTTPTEENVLALQSTIYRYATALFDGESTEVLNQILNECL